MLRTARRAITSTLATVAVAIVVAMVAARCVAALRWMIRWPSDSDRWWTAVLVAGALLAVVIVHRARTTGETTAAFVRSLDDPPGRLRPVPARMAAAASGVGLGTPLGLDGPALHFGGALGARAARALRQSERAWTIAGGVAALSMAINAPVAAAAFALEVGNRRVRRWRDVMPLAAGGFGGWLIRRLSGDPGGVLARQPDLPLQSLVLSVGTIGVLCGVAGVWFGAAIERASTTRWGVGRRLLVAGVALTMSVGGAWLATGRRIFVGSGGIFPWARSSSALPVAAALAALVLLLLALLAADLVGGMLLPMLAVGNLIGLLLADTWLGGTSTTFAVVAGGCALVASASNAPLTAIALGFAALGWSAASWAAAVTVVVAVAASGRRPWQHVRS